MKRQVLVMAMSTVKPVKIVKRSERERLKALDSTPDSRTLAQVRREMVAVVTSWISDNESVRKQVRLDGALGATGNHRLF
jgi:hypothetical protein